MVKEVGSAICKGNKAIGISHLHPSGSIRLSSGDIKTAKVKSLRFVCVETPRGERKCYRFNHRKKPGG